jgi:hypothetical protein
MSVDLISLVAGSGWASGVNLYAVIVMLGLLGRLGWAEIPLVLQRTDLLVAAGGLYLFEFVADKVPYVDSGWDVLHTVVRPLGAAAVGYMLAGQADTFGQAAAAAVAAALAAASHTAKATTRAAVNLSPEPFTNIGLSLLEDGLVFSVIALAVTYPAAALATVAVLVLAGAMLVVTLWGAARRWYSRAPRRA